MKSLKNQKAITLISLIITIIILIILSAVSINVIINGDLLDTILNSKNKIDDDKAKEAIKLAYLDYERESLIDTTLDAEEYINQRLGYYLGNENINGFNYSNGKLVARVNVQNNEKVFEFDRSNSQTQERQFQDIGTLTKNNYGDYIDLGQNVVGTSATTDDWRIIYNDKEGKVYVILADYLPNSSGVASSAGLNQVSGKMFNVNSSTSSESLINALDHSTAWKVLVAKKYRDLFSVKGAITPDILMASYNEKYNTNYSYSVNQYLRTDPNNNSSSIDTLYVPRPGNTAYNGCWGYWMALPYTTNNTIWRIDCIGCISYHYYYTPDIGICPIVVLPSNTKVISTVLEGKIIWSIV